MRWAALLVLLVATEAAAKRVVIREPPIVRACPGGKSWDAVQKCIDRQGKVTVERVLDKAKLVRIVQQVNNVPNDLGVYLYVQDSSGAWHMGGMFDNSGPYLVTDAKPLTIAKHTGYRIDIAPEQLETAGARPGDSPRHWMPACAGMTGYRLMPRRFAGTGVSAPRPAPRSRAAPDSATAAAACRGAPPTGGRASLRWCRTAPRPRGASTCGRSCAPC